MNVSFDYKIGYQMHQQSIAQSSTLNRKYNTKCNSNSTISTKGIGRSSNLLAC